MTPDAPARTWRSPIYLTLAGLLAFFMSVATATAQTAELRSAVVDDTWAVLPGVTVIIRNDATGVS